jgi:DNA polymerase-3 subunit beta
MNFSIQRESFLKALQKVVGAVGRRPNMPIISNVLMVVKNQLLSLTGTDLELELVARVPLAQPSLGGEVTLPAKKLLDVCKAFPEGIVMEFELVPSKPTEGPKVQIKAGKSCFTIIGLSAEGFPKVEEGSGILEFSLMGQEIRALIDRASFAMAGQDVRYFLNGLFVELQKDKIRSVASDGHRLATCSLVPKHKIDLNRAQSIIIPRKAIVEIQRLFSEGNEAVGLTMSTHHLRAITTEFSFCTKLIDGKFPDYRKVLPNQACFEVIIDRALFKQSLLRVAVLLSDKQRAACLRFDKNVIKFSAINTDHDRVEEELEVQYEGPAMEIGLNVGYLIDYLNVEQAATIKMKLIDPSQSVLLEPFEMGPSEESHSLYVVMPVKL